MPDTERPRRTPEPSPLPNAETPKSPLKGFLGALEFEAPPLAFQGGSQSKPSGWKLMAWSWAATLIDALIVLSLVCLFLFVSLLIERAGIRLWGARRELIVNMGLLVFPFLYATYLIFLRIFMGSSLGEWACDLRCGEPRQRFSSRYSLLVLARFFVVVGTGVVVLPLASMASGIDWAGRISGLPLVSVNKRSRV